jgi:hypothetical protein
LAPADGGCGSFVAFTSETASITRRYLAKGTGGRRELANDFPEESRKKAIGSLVLPGGIIAISSFPLSVASTSPHCRH